MRGKDALRAYWAKGLQHLPDLHFTVEDVGASVDTAQWRPAHGEWLNQLIAQRLFLAVGRQVSLVGGVYLASGMPTEELDRLLATDPYVIKGVATHTVTEFTPLLVAPGLEALKDT